MECTGNGCDQSHNKVTQLLQKRHGDQERFLRTGQKHNMPLSLEQLGGQSREPHAGQPHLNPGQVTQLPGKYFQAKKVWEDIIRDL